jgi:large subunit ribosomal protein L17
MPQPRRGPSLGADPAHQQLMVRNLARSLFEHERIKTTEARARVLRPFADRLITKAKKGTLHHRRQVLSAIEDRAVVHKLFAEIAPRFEARDGGYTRMLKLGPRNGDGAAMALVELVDGPGDGAGGGTSPGDRGRRRLRRPGRRRSAAAGLPSDKPARSRAAEAGAAGTPPGRGEEEDAPAREAAPDTEADAAPDDGAGDEGASGAGGEPGKQGG